MKKPQLDNESMTLIGFIVAGLVVLVFSVIARYSP